MKIKIHCQSLIILLVVIVILSPTVTIAHPGRTDSSGCHTCRTNCPNWGLSYGEYHCHRSKGVSQPKEPIRSHYGEGGTGSTESWPEYKNQSSFSSPSVSTIKQAVPTVVPSFTYTLSKGMHNSQVTKLQQILARYSEIYPEGLITGYFGVATESAVKRFQERYSLNQVGYVGPGTRKLLNSL